MPFTIAMYDKSHAHIAARLAGLGLDIRLATFGKDCLYEIDGRKLSPSEVDVDYMWLTSHLNADGFRDPAFDLCLATRAIKVLQTFNAGLDHPFYKRLAAKGTRICNSSAQGIAIAEYTFAQVMAVLQPIELQRDLQRRREWRNTPFREVSQTRWLIIGFGPIGQAIAKRAKAFEAAVDVIRRSPAPSPDADRVGTAADLASYLHEADIVVLACPLTEETRGLAGQAFFAGLKQGAILVNIARGGLVDDAALLTALDNGRLSTAILDVFHEEPLPAASPLWAHAGVRLTSHTSFAGSGARSRWDALFLDNVARFVRGEPLALEVDPRAL
ncbi:MAG: NAD(P)-dependent oxidoreductase [Hyphomicrobiaceae bacterium]|nr:NAD(P)-dependent oxidoreductase [Hyphomicrobiaceae bacterium]